MAKSHWNCVAWFYWGTTTQHALHTETMDTGTGRRPDHSAGSAQWCWQDALLIQPTESWTVTGSVDWKIWRPCLFSPDPYRTCWRRGFYPTGCKTCRKISNWCGGTQRCAFYWAGRFWGAWSPRMHCRWLCPKWRQTPQTLQPWTIF